MGFSRIKPFLESIEHAKSRDIFKNVVLGLFFFAIWIERLVLIVKTEKTKYLSNQLTYAYFDWKFIFPMKFRTSEQIFIFWNSKMFQISGSPTVKLSKPPVVMAGQNGVMENE